MQASIGMIPRIEGEENVLVKWVGRIAELDLVFSRRVGRREEHVI